MAISLLRRLSEDLLITVLLVSAVILVLMVAIGFYPAIWPLGVYLLIMLTIWVSGRNE